MEKLILGYSRVSSEEQAQHGISVDAQRTILEGYAAMTSSTIQIYEDNAEETQMVIDSLEDERIKVNIRDMLLAHEVCHALQNKHPELFIHKPLISLWKLFGYENVSKLVSLEEVCAMYFAKSFLHMSCMPYVYDVFMCMSRAPKRAREIYEMIMDLKEECHE